MIKPDFYNRYNFYKRLYIVLFAVLLLPATSFAQETVPPTTDPPGIDVGGEDGNNYSHTLPSLSKFTGFYDNFIPSSPQAASMIRYVDFPMSYSLGIPKIVIPLYTIKSRELEVPITLSYHASGIKIGDVGGSAGIGWTLNAGGVVTREVRGKMDGAGSNITLREENYYMPQPYGMASYLESVILNENDSYWDKFTYCYPGGGGSFIFEHGVGGIVTMTSQNDDDIDIISVGNGSFEFIITDKHGTAYYFRDEEWVKFHAPIEWDESIFKKLGDYTGPSAWYLTEIISANKTDTIRFEYSLSGESEWVKKINTRNILYKQQPKVKNWQRERSSNSISYLTYYNLLGVSKIHFNGNSVEFDYYDYIPQEEKLDMGVESGQLYVQENCNWPFFIQDMAVYNMQQAESCVMKIEFGKIKFGDNRPGISNILFKDKDNNIFDRYDFEYYDPAGSTHFFSQDRYGYYNGKTSNQSLLFLTLSPNERSDRSYDFSSARQYALKNMKRITGVKTEFEYEENSYEFSEDPTLGILSNSGDLDDPGGEGLGEIEDGEKKDPPGTGGGSGGDNTGQISEVIEHAASLTAGGDKIGIRVKKIVTRDGNENIIKTREFKYEGNRITMRPDVSPIDYYSGYETYILIGTHNTVRYDYQPWAILSETRNNPGARKEDTRIYHTRVKEYIYENDSAKAMRIDYLYDLDQSNDAGGGFIEGYGEGVEEGTGPSDTQDRYVTTPFGGYMNTYYKIRPYFFDNATGKIYYEKTGISNSDDDYREVRRESNEYTDYNMFKRSEVTVGLFVLDVLARQSGIHRYARIPNPVEDCLFFNVKEDVGVSQPVSSTTIDYFNEGTNKEIASSVAYASGYPSLVSSTTQNKEGISKITTYKYPFDFSENDVLKSMVRRNQLSPVVKEELKIGNTVISTTEKTFTERVVGGKNIILPTTITTTYGNNPNTAQSTNILYDDNGNPIEVTDHKGVKTVYVWGYNNTLLVAEIKNATLSQVESKLTAGRIADIGNGTSLTTNQLSFLRSLRTRLPNAHVTVYEHKPLVGVLSITDPSGRKLFYEYDNANRLKLIRDEDGNVVEKYEYNYARP